MDRMISKSIDNFVMTASIYLANGISNNPWLGIEHQDQHLIKLAYALYDAVYRVAGGELKRAIERGWGDEGEIV